MLKYCRHTTCRIMNVHMLLIKHSGWEKYILGDIFGSGRFSTLPSMDLLVLTLIWELDPSYGGEGEYPQRIKKNHYYNQSVCLHNCHVLFCVCVCVHVHMFY
jgi:hypothetical protein